jgi:hypothetical protein
VPSTTICHYAPTGGSDMQCLDSVWVGYHRPNNVYWTTALDYQCGKVP